MEEPRASSLGQWQSIETPPPRDTTLLAVYEPTESNTTYFGKVPATVHPFYVDEIGRFCDCGDWRPDIGVRRGSYRITHWMPLPLPPSSRVSGGSPELSENQALGCSLK